MIRGLLIAVVALGLAACGETDESGEPIDGKIELDMMDDGTIVSRL
jgi:hypothetical protein